MTVRPFVDTNIVAYSVGRDSDKRRIAREILSRHATLSTQVISEFLNVCRIKLRFDVAQLHRLANEIIASSYILVIDSATILKAMQIEAHTGYSYWDSLILATAMLAGCDTVLSEDMQHGQVIEDTVRIVNPFINRVIP